MKSLHSDPTPEHNEYPCKLDMVNDARKELDRWEFKGYKKHLKAAIAILKKVLET